MNVSSLKRHIPQTILLVLCIVRTVTWMANMTSYLALYVDKKAGILTDFSMCLWGIVGVAVAIGLVFRLARKVSAWMTFAVATLDILACIFFTIVNGGLMMLFILASLFLSIAMLLLGVITLRTLDGKFISDRLEWLKRNQ